MFNKSRNDFPCLPDCPDRKPGCHGHCQRYKDKRAEFDKRKLEVYGDPIVNQYFRDLINDRADKAAKNRKNHGLNRSSCIDR